MKGLCIVLALATVACGAATHQPSWAWDDPNRPLMFAGDAAAITALAAAARECRLSNLDHLTVTGLDWIIVRDVLATAPLDRGPVKCVLDWRSAHPEIQIYVFGRAGASN